MAGDGAAGERVVDLLKAAVLAQELFDSLHDLRIHAGVGDKHAFLVEIVVILDAVGHIALDRLGERAAVLFRNAHLALVHLDAGLELQKIRAQRRDGRAPAALAQIFERVDHEADVQLLPALVKDRLTQDDCKNGFIFDGFPRTTVQAEEFDKILAGHGLKVDVMIDIHVPEEELVRRILLRGKDSGRADDASEEVIRGRLDVYREQTAVVADYYAAQGKYASVNGTGTMEEVFSRIAAVIEGLK